MSEDNDILSNMTDYLQHVSPTLNEGEADQYENGQFSQYTEQFDSEESIVAPELVQRSINSEENDNKNKWEKVKKGIKEGHIRDFDHNVENDIETHIQSLDDECIFQCKCNNLAYSDVTDNQKVILLMDTLSNDMRLQLTVFCEQTVASIDAISYGEFCKLVIKQYGTQKILINIVLQYFDDNRLLKEKESPMFIHNVNFMNNLDPCMQPNSAEECRKFVDLIQRTAYYASLSDPEVQKALLKIPDEEATLTKFMDVALQITGPITSHYNMKATMGLNEDTEDKVVTCDIEQNSALGSENGENFSDNGISSHMITHNEDSTHEIRHEMNDTVSHISSFVKPYQCSLCEKRFLKVGDLNRHMVIHTGERPHQCGQCGKSFAYKVVLKRHMALHTGEIREKPHKCNLCDKAYICNSHLMKHMRDHTGERPHKCTQCDKDFKLKSHLREHLRVHSGETFNCDECDQTFTRPTSLKNHMARHVAGYTEERTCICNQCGKAFKSNSELSRHLVVHSGERPYECSQCGKTFPFKSSLKLHMLTHSGKGERPFQCSQCDKTFSLNSLLLVHMRNHTGEKPFKCTQCDKAFQVKRSLTDHMRGHIDIPQINLMHFMDS